MIEVVRNVLKTCKGFMGLTFCAILLLASKLYSQNLIDNPSFENINIDKLEEGFYSTTGFNKCMLGHKADSLSRTPDLFMDTYKKFVSSCFLKHTKAYDGNVGIHLCSTNNIDGYWKESVLLKLNDQIVKGRKYHMSFYARILTLEEARTQSRLTSSMKIPNENLGVEISFGPGDQRLSFNCYSFNLEPNYKKYESEFIAEKDFEGYLRLGYIDCASDANIDEEYGQQIIIDHIELYEYTDTLVEHADIIVSRRDTFSLFFDTNSSSLGVANTEFLDSILTSLSHDQVEISAYASSLGQYAHNMELSRMRANSVESYIKNKRPSSKIVKRAYGESKSSTQASDDIDNDRRVDIVYTSDGDNRKSSKTSVDFEEYNVSSKCVTPEELSWIMQYNEAKELADSKNTLKFNEQDVETIKASKILSAKRYILNQAKKTSITMFNEAHHIPTNRVVVLDYLDSLYNQGYRTLCVEALKMGVVIPAHSKCIEANDYYLADPLFRLYLEKASSIGFTIYGYEESMQQKRRNAAIVDSLQRDWVSISNSVEYIGGDPYYNDMNRRDYSHFENVKEVFNTTNGEKMIIHCGYGHLNEVVVNNWKSLAYWIKKDMHIDPLTIDQTTNVDLYDAEDFYTLIDDRVKQPFLLLTPKNKLFNRGTYDIATSQKIKLADIQMFYPKDLFLNDTDHPVFNHLNRVVECPDYDQRKFTFPHLLIAYDVDCDNNVVDVKEVDESTGLVKLLIPKSTNVRYCVKDENGKIVYLSNNSSN